MKWFGSGRKKASSTDPEEAAAQSFHASSPPQPNNETKSDIVVYGLENDRRCQALRDLLKDAGFAFRDERVDDDLATRAWLQRLTGDDALPKLFVGTQCHGSYEEIQSLAFRDELKQVLTGKTVAEELNHKRLRAEMSIATIIQLLRDQESLIVNEDGVETETWLEPPGSPNFILVEGKAHPIAEMENIVTRIVERHRRGEISLGWRSDQE